MYVQRLRSVMDKCAPPPPRPRASSGNASDGLFWRCVSYATSEEAACCSSCSRSRDEGCMSPFPLIFTSRSFLANGRVEGWVRETKALIADAAREDNAKCAPPPSRRVGLLAHRAKSKQLPA